MESRNNHNHNHNHNLSQNNTDGYSTSEYPNQQYEFQQDGTPLSQEQWMQHLSQYSPEDLQNMNQYMQQYGGSQNIPQQWQYNDNNNNNNMHPQHIQSGYGYSPYDPMVGNQGMTYPPQHQMNYGFQPQQQDSNYYQPRYSDPNMVPNMSTKVSNEELVIDPESLKQEDPGILKAFVNTLEQFICAVEVGWPDCPKIKDYKAKFLIAKMAKFTQEKMVKEYHNSMEKFYDACSNKNFKPVLESDIKWLKNIDLDKKWEEIKDDIDAQDALSEYIIDLNKYSRLYNKIPTRIVGKIEGVALNLAKNLHSGKMKPKDLDLFKIGQSVLEGADGGEISQLMSNMGNIYNAVGGVESMKETFGSNVKIPNMNIGAMIGLAQNNYNNGEKGMPIPSEMFTSKQAGTTTISNGKQEENPNERTEKTNSSKPSQPSQQSQQPQPSHVDPRMYRTGYKPRN